MASSAPKDDPAKKGKGFGRIFSRVKVALRRGDSSKAKPPDAGAPLQPPDTKAGPVVKIPSPPPVPEPFESPSRFEGMEGVAKVARSKLFKERAKKLAERYGLDISASDWIRTPPNDTVLRIDKPIRIRVRRTCHRCNIPLSQAKECPSCQHPRCTKCSRYPPNRTEAEKLASREKRAALIQANKENPPLTVDYSYHDKGLVLKRPSKTGGQDLYQKKPRQRVRRTCHECQVVFAAGSKKCSGCAHIRCTDCPRDPPKKDKYPFGYPGDAFGPNSVPRYECQRCEALYAPGAEHGNVCKKCGHENSEASPRALPRKVEPEPDPEILKMIQANLDRLKVA